MKNYIGLYAQKWLYVANEESYLITYKKLKAFEVSNDELEIMFDIFDVSIAHRMSYKNQRICSLFICTM